MAKSYLPPGKIRLVSKTKQKSLSQPQVNKTSNDTILIRLIIYLKKVLLKKEVLEDIKSLDELKQKFLEYKKGDILYSKISKELFIQIENPPIKGGMNDPINGPIFF